MAITEKQKKFVKAIALYDMQPAEAYTYAGYVMPKDRLALWKNISELLGNKQINDAIDKLRRECFDVEEVRKKIILEHNTTRDLDITSIMEPCEYYDDQGNLQTRLSIKPIREWSPELRKACTGFDRFGIPKFRDKDSATKELSRIFGLYKDNQIIVQQDTDSVINDALGIPNDTNTDPDVEAILSPDAETKADSLLDALDASINERTEKSNSEESENEAEPTIQDKISLALM